MGTISHTWEFGIHFTFIHFTLTVHKIRSLIYCPDILQYQVTDLIWTKFRPKYLASPTWYSSVIAYQTCLALPWVLGQPQICQKHESRLNWTVSDYFAYASFRLPKFAYAFFVSPTEIHPSVIMFLFIKNTNILSSGVFLVKYLGEKQNVANYYKTSWQPTHDLNNTEFDNSFSSNHYIFE